MTEIAGTRPAAIRPGAAAPRAAGTIESRESWIAAGLTLALLSVSYGSPLLIVVGLKPIAEDLGTQRQLVALVGSLTWFGTGLGGIFMGQVAERIGMRPTVMFGATMIAAGLAVSRERQFWAILVGHGLLVGLLGNGALYPPLIVYVSRWFDRRRGTALALISSGQYVAGMVWPTLFECGMRAGSAGGDMLAYGGLAAAMLVAGIVAARSLPRDAGAGPRSAESASAGRGAAGAGPAAESGARADLRRRVPAAACRWRCRRGIWSRSAAISASRRRRAR